MFAINRIISLFLLVVGSNGFVGHARSQSSTGKTALSSSAMFDGITFSKSPGVIGVECEAGGTILIEPAMIQKQKFPIRPEKLVSRAKFAVRRDSGVLDPSLLSNDFEFCAPYGSPLNKEQFLDTVRSLGIYQAFPDLDNRYFGFTVDPVEPGRVWFFVRCMATNTGGLLGKPPNHKTVELPPQVHSFKFNEKGLIREMTVGYTVDRRQGNTGGVGGIYGLFYGVGQGLPFREGKPYKLSKRFRLFSKVQKIVSKFSNHELKL